VRHYNLRAEPRFTWSWYYLICTGGLSLLGGFIAWILPTTNYSAAFCVGVVTPVIVNPLLKEPQIDEETGRRIFREEREKARLIDEGTGRRIAREEIAREKRGEPSITAMSKDAVGDRDLLTDRSKILGATRIWGFIRILNRWRHSLRDYFQALS
jgi:hypothetical protein